VSGAEAALGGLDLLANPDDLPSKGFSIKRADQAYISKRGGTYEDELDRQVVIDSVVQAQKSIPKFAQMEAHNVSIHGRKQERDRNALDLLGLELGNQFSMAACAGALQNDGGLHHQWEQATPRFLFQKQTYLGALLVGEDDPANANHIEEKEQHIVIDNTDQQRREEANKEQA
jgi:hypothetical protein